MVKEYQTEKDYLVLSLIKKYPTYSLDRLMELLPGISRHSLQLILEKNNLSTLEKRLAFADQPKRGLFFLFKRLKSLPLFFKTRCQDKSRLSSWLNWRLGRTLLFLIVVLFLFYKAIDFYSAKPPEINLEQPGTDWINKGEKLFVVGRVTPKDSQVWVNNQPVLLNGDGSFTAVAKIPLGESVLQVEARKARKTASILRLVNRVPSDEEVKAKEEEEAKKAKAMLDQSAELDRTINDLLAARNAGIGESNLLRVVNNHVQESAGFTSIIGEVVNLGKEAATWVMVTAKFFDQNNQLIDTKYGFATDFDEILDPKGRSNFETQATRKQFSYYTLEISWEKEKVAGASTEATPESKLATPSISPH